MTPYPIIQLPPQTKHMANNPIVKQAMLQSTIICEYAQTELDQGEIDNTQKLVAIAINNLAPFFD